MSSARANTFSEVLSVIYNDKLTKLHSEGERFSISCPVLEKQQKILTYPLYLLPILNGEEDHLTCIFSIRHAISKARAQELTRIAGFLHLLLGTCRTHRESNVAIKNFWGVLCERLLEILEDFSQHVNTKVFSVMTNENRKAMDYLVRFDAIIYFLDHLQDHLSGNADLIKRVNMSRSKVERKYEALLEEFAIVEAEAKRAAQKQQQQGKQKGGGGDREKDRGMTRGKVPPAPIPPPAAPMPVPPPQLSSATTTREREAAGSRSAGRVRRIISDDAPPPAPENQKRKIGFDPDAFIAKFKAQVAASKESDPAAAALAAAEATKKAEVEQEVPWKHQEDQPPPQPPQKEQQQPQPRKKQKNNPPPQMSAYPPPVPFYPPAYPFPPVGYPMPPPMYPYPMPGAPPMMPPVAAPTTEVEMTDAADDDDAPPPGLE